MNAPSNANTSGLEVVAWDSDVLDTFSGFSSNVLTRKPHVAKTGERVRSQAALVTAASAQARIEHLLARIETARVARVEHNRQFEAMKDRATAAEARADRLAKAVDAAIQCLCTRIPGGVLHGDETMSVLRAALQQETQP
ncbi:hypothetical protein [Brevundimonas sp.]|uniref:hypothetical protein n=1 Tax=Brevundimonas sp. TaxID=1871086 RepID=UPI0028B26470|nr:hypothetical protein [Brevundimonas sp.]